jgi:hypothetical protein
MSPALPHPPAGVPARRSRYARHAAVLLLLAATQTGRPAQAQLRPIDPLDWGVFERTDPVALSIGAGVLYDQRASLAGTQGTLYEIGNFSVNWRTGRIGLELAGTLHRRFTDRVVFRPPSLGANPPDGEARRDAGDIRAITMVRMFGSGQSSLVLLRFGTRLPTTSEEQGLDRDRTDFFAAVAGRWRRGDLSLSGESGLGIYGTRLPDYDQSDVLIYAAGIEYRFGALVPGAWLTGHHDGTPREVTGNDNLSELRIGLRAGRRRWVQATYVRGFATYSPGHGVLVTGGITL